MIHTKNILTAKQRVAMRMGYMAIWSDESVLQRPPSKDRGRSQARHAQGPGCPYLRDRDLDSQALRRPKAQRGESLQPGTRHPANTPRWMNKSGSSSKKTSKSASVC